MGMNDTVSNAPLSDARFALTVEDAQRIPIFPHLSSTPKVISVWDNLVKELYPLLELYPNKDKFLQTESWRAVMAVGRYLYTAAFSSKKEAKEKALSLADEELVALKIQFKLALDMQVIAPKGYQSIVRLALQVGREIGAWKASVLVR
jgi:hypothetical protein